MTDNLEDKAQHLPKGTSVVNRYRLQHGDIDTKVHDSRYSQAWVKDKTIARYLIKRGFIEEYHLAYGIDLLELRNALYGPLNAKTSAFMFTIGDCSLKRNHAERLYFNVAKAIGEAAEGSVQRALSVPAGDDLKYEFVANVYRAAFEVLADEMEYALKELREKIAKEAKA